jgi:hypothetical protein
VSSFASCKLQPIYTLAGVVYYANNVLTGEGIAVKMESLDADNPKLSHEWKVYKSLSGGLGIPRVSWFGSERGYRAMTMSLLGPSLENIFDACNLKFTLKTVLMLADQLVSFITFIHSSTGQVPHYNMTRRFPVLNTSILDITSTVISNLITFSWALIVSASWSISSTLDLQTDIVTKSPSFISLTTRTKVGAPNDKYPIRKFLEHRF